MLAELQQQHIQHDGIYHLVFVLGEFLWLRLHQCGCPRWMQLKRSSVFLF